MRRSMLVVIGVLAIGCSSDRGEPSETAETSGEERATTGGESMPQAMADCPMHVPGTTVQAENVEGGAALVFTTSGDVQALRESVRNMATTRESRAESQEMGMSETMRPGSAEDPAAGAKMGGSEEGASAADMPEESAAQSMMPIEVDTRVEEIEGGARLVIVATNASDVDALRMHAERHAQRMSAGECAMGHHAMHPTGATMQE